LLNLQNSVEYLKRAKETSGNGEIGKEQSKNDAKIFIKELEKVNNAMYYR
jgi:hypothetical protein